MKYISLFSGIGGFELGIRMACPTAMCIGFSEIDKYAIKVYTHHFPEHVNLGDVTRITEEDIRVLLKKHGGCDLLVGGFPCTNLTSLARCYSQCNSNGLNGPSSGLFWTMRDIIKWVVKYNTRNLDIVIENNASMSTTNQLLITEQLVECIPDVRVIMLNSAEFGVQTRRRLYWTTFPINVNRIRCEQSWQDILLPIKDVYDLCATPARVNLLNAKMSRVGPRAHKAEKTDDGGWTFSVIDESSPLTRWNLSEHHDTCTENILAYPCGKSRPITRTSFKPLVDRRREGGFLIRKFHPIEMERLFWFPDDWTGALSSDRRRIVLGNSVVIKVIEFIVKNLDDLRTGLRFPGNHH